MPISTAQPSLVGTYRLSSSIQYLMPLQTLRGTARREAVWAGAAPKLRRALADPERAAAAADLCLALRGPNILRGLPAGDVTRTQFGAVLCAVGARLTPREVREVARRADYTRTDRHAYAHPAIVKA